MKPGYKLIALAISASFFIFSSPSSSLHHNVLQSTIIKTLIDSSTKSTPYNTNNFSFTLNQDATTSAGVYSSEGTLIRTLWSAIRYTAGTHTSSWDGTDDEGRLAPDGNYTVRVLSNNVRYTWEGVIGNTSDSLTGSGVYHNDNWFWNFAFNGSTVYYAQDYSEAFTS